MSRAPMVTVVTPTWRRHGLLAARCIPSVQAQDYPATEHVIISDGPDEELTALLGRGHLDQLATRDIRRGWHHLLWYYELAVHDSAPHWGGQARRRGIELAAADLITYCDDDDALRPQHVALLARALADSPDAGFAISLMASHSPWGITEIGHGPPALGNVGTPMIMHRRSVLEWGTWGLPSPYEDWEMVNCWLHAGVPYVRVDEVTSDVWPSVMHHPDAGARP